MSDKIMIRKNVRAFMARTRYIETSRLIEFIGRWLPERDSCEATLKQMLDAGALNEKGGYVWSNDPAPEPDTSNWLSPADFADAYEVPEYHVLAAIDLGDLDTVEIDGKPMIDMLESEPWALCLRAELVRLGRA